MMEGSAGALDREVERRIRQILDFNGPIPDGTELGRRIQRDQRRIEEHQSKRSARGQCGPNRAGTLAGHQAVASSSMTYRPKPSRTLLTLPTCCV